MTLYEQFTEKQWALLQHRARRVEKAVKATDTGNLEDVLVINVGQERYAVPVNVTRAVYDDIRVHSLPTVAGHIAGIANVRGHIATVLDVATILHVVDDDPETYTLIMLDFDDMYVALRVQAVREVIRIASNDLKSISGETRSFVKGVLKDGTVLLDLLEIITDPSLTIDQKQ